MGDLHATKFDAAAMYDFLSNVVCKDLRDITIMSSELDFHRLFKKPEYQGDFLTQMFDWNLNEEFTTQEIKQVNDLVV